METRQVRQLQGLQCRQRFVQGLRVQRMADRPRIEVLGQCHASDGADCVLYVLEPAQRLWRDAAAIQPLAVSTFRARRLRGGLYGREHPLAMSNLVAEDPASFVTIDDHTGRTEVALFDETWTLYADLLNKDEIVVVEGLVSGDDFSGGYRVSAQKIMTLSEAKSRFARGVQVSLRGPGDDVCAALQATFVPYRDGSARVWLDYSNARARARLELGEEWGVKACEELVAALSELEMVSDARLIY
jgi:hypothetical protein